MCGRYGAPNQAAIERHYHLGRDENNLWRIATSKPERAFPHSLAQIGGRDNAQLMRDLLLLAIHLFVTVAKFLRPGGVRAVAANMSVPSPSMGEVRRSVEQGPVYGMRP